MEKVEKDGVVVEVIFTDDDLDKWSKDPLGMVYANIINTPEIGTQLRFNLSTETHTVSVARGKRGNFDNRGGSVSPGGKSKNFSGVKVTNRCRLP